MGCGMTKGEAMTSSFPKQQPSNPCQLSNSSKYIMLQEVSTAAHPFDYSPLLPTPQRDWFSPPADFVGRVQQGPLLLPLGRSRCRLPPASDSLLKIAHPRHGRLPAHDRRQVLHPRAHCEELLDHFAHLRGGSEATLSSA